MLLIARGLPLGIGLFFVVSAVGFLGEVWGGRVVYGLGLLSMAGFTARDWWRLRRSEDTPQAVADRLAMDVLIFVFMLALPGLEIIVGAVGD
jgi:hypothetical protein